MIRLITILFFAIGLTAGPVLAQQQTAKMFLTQQPCDVFDKMFDTIKKYGEEMLFTGDGIQFSAPSGQPFKGGSFFFVNQDSGTWSHIMIYGDGMACMVANGQNFAPYSGPQPYDQKKDKS